MQKYLLDVNVLIALVHAGHVHHKIALDWFLKNHENIWATCPITEDGLIRIMSNPKFLSKYDRPIEVVEHFKLIKERFPNHEFFPNEISLIENDILNLPLIVSPKYLTDAYLLATAYKNEAKLATLDKGITKNWLKDKNADSIEYL